MKLKSSAFKDGERIPDIYVMKEVGGENMSLPFEWSDAPDETRSFAFTMIDHHPVANNWIHWMVINIPSSSDNICEGASGRNMTVGSREFRNSFGKGCYGGPQPPVGSGDHPYVCTLYAISVRVLYLDLTISLSEFKAGLEGRILAQASMTGIYGI